MKKVKIKKSEFEKLYKMACTTWVPRLDEKLKPFIFSDTVEFDEGFMLDMQKACTTEQLVVFKKIFKGFLGEDKLGVTDYATVCKMLKRKVLTIKDFAFLPENQRKKALHQHMVMNLEDFFNEGWIPDWTNSSERKHYPWFERRTGGWVFFGSGYFGSYSYGQAGFYKTSEISDHIGKYFLEVYKPLLG